MFLTILVICYLWDITAAWGTLQQPYNTKFSHNFILLSHKLNCGENTSLDFNENGKDDVCIKVIGESLRQMLAVQDCLNEQIPDLVEVKQSTIPGAGMGLFAKETIEAGTVVAFYPAHILGINIGETTRRITLDSSNKVMELPAREEEDSNDHEYIQYIIGSRPILSHDVSKDLGADSIFLDVDLKRPSIPLWNSHRINDGAIVLSNTEDGILKYYRDSRIAKNCVNIPFGPSPLLATITCKTLSRGEELFTTYGCSYWLESLLTQTGETEEAYITDCILQESKIVALDIFNLMKDAVLKYKHQMILLESTFNRNDLRKI